MPYLCENEFRIGFTILCKETYSHEVSKLCNTNSWYTLLGIERGLGAVSLKKLTSFVHRFKSITYKDERKIYSRKFKSTGSLVHKRRGYLHFAGYML